MDELNIDLFYRKDTTLLGQSVVHSWAELYFIEKVLRSYHFDSIIETGTYRGGLSLFFGLHAMRMGAKAVTFDILPEPTEALYKKLKPLLPLEFYQLDCVSDEATKIIYRYTSLGRTLLYCDAMKVGEFNLYAPILKVGDVIMAHDRANEMAVKNRYAREIWDKDIKDVVQMCNLQPFHDKEANQLGAIYSFIKRGV